MNYNIFETEEAASIAEQSDLAEHIAGLPTEKTYTSSDTGEEILVPIDNSRYIEKTINWSIPRQRATDGKWCTAVCEHSTAEGRTIEEKQEDWNIV